MIKRKAFRRYGISPHIGPPVYRTENGYMKSEPDMSKFVITEMDDLNLQLRSEVTDDPAKLLSQWIAENTEPEVKDAVQR